MAKPAGKKKKVAVRKPLATAEAPVNYLLDGRILPNRVEANLALTLSADDPKKWVTKTGMTPSSLAKKARAALVMDFLRHNTCTDCGRKRPELAAEERFLIYPGMSLCICRMPSRELDHTYIQAWDTPDGRTQLTKAVLEGELAAHEPVYQYAKCQRCHTGPVVVRAGLVVRHILRFKQHRARPLCERCDLQAIASEMEKEQKRRDAQALRSKPLTAPIIEFPKASPAGKFKKKNQHTRGRAAPQQGVAIPEASLPPLAAFTGTPETPTTE
jgi:hypothetical protein